MTDPLASPVISLVRTELSSCVRASELPVTSQCLRTSACSDFSSGVHSATKYKCGWMDRTFVSGEPCQEMFRWYGHASRSLLLAFSTSANQW